MAGQQTSRSYGRCALVAGGVLGVTSLLVAVSRASRFRVSRGPGVIDLPKSPPLVAQEYYPNGYSGTANGYGTGSGSNSGGYYDPYNDPAVYGGYPNGQGAQPDPAAYAGYPAAQIAQPDPTALAPQVPAVPPAEAAPAVADVAPPAEAAVPPTEAAPAVADVAPPAEAPPVPAEADSGLKLPALPAVQKCSFASEDCHETKCCSNVECDYLYQDCSGFTCYKKDEFDGGFAGCKPSPPGDWLGTVLGGPIEPREIEKAPGDTQTQGTSLFCITVVTAGPPKEGWQDEETVLAENWKRKGRGILQCDGHMIIDGQAAGGSSWGSTANIDVFFGYWDQVQSDGRYKQHDWVVKVDADAVFFPDRLKAHVDALRTPKGARVLLLNNAYKFQFLGALEVLTREALDLYFENKDRCSTMTGHSGGEDFFFKSCWLGIGIDKQTDFELLHDKYAAQDGCFDAWAAAFHFYKNVGDWNTCYDQAVSAA